MELDTHDIICTDEESAGKALIALPEASLRCRLSPLYLSLSAAGCLAATATILALIAHLTRSKRRKRLAYAAPNRPEFLVYVGRSNDELDKSGESYSRRLLARGNEEGGSPYESPGGRKVGARDANVYETPGYARPNNRDETGQAEEGVYAVADVTDLRGDEPVEEVLSLYRMQNATSNVHRNLDYAYDYDYDYEPPLPHKPHVVFV